MRRRRGSRSVDLTPQALTLMLTVVLMHSVWQQSGAQIAIVIEVGVIAALVINLGWAARTAERATVTVVGCPTDAIAGEEVGSDVVIAGTRSPIDVRLISSPDARRYRIDPPDRGRISAVAGSRGIATAAVFEVRSAAPLGLIGAARRFVVPLPHPLYVGPQREPIPTARLPDLGIDDVPAELVRGTRPYVPGDPLRLVHWPSTARTGALAVREFEPPPAPELVVIVDLTGARRAGETAARQAAWLADEGLRRGLSVVLATCEAEGPVTARVRAPFDVSRRLAAAVPGSPIPPTPDARRPRTFVWLTAADVTS